MQELTKTSKDFVPGSLEHDLMAAIEQKMVESPELDYASALRIVARERPDLDKRYARDRRGVDRSPEVAEVLRKAIPRLAPEARAAAERQLADIETDPQETLNGIDSELIGAAKKRMTESPSLPFVESLKLVASESPHLMVARSSAYAHLLGRE